VHLGDRTGLPKSVIRVLDNIEKNNSDEKRLILNIAFNYSGRSEIVRAARVLADMAGRGELKPEEITEELFSRHLFTADMPDPDLFIRTAGELRVSNYLLWQIAYTEIWVTDILWPDFTGAVLRDAVRDYQNRERRFGGAPPEGNVSPSGSSIG